MSPIDIYRKESIQDTLSDSLTLEDGTSATYLDTDAAGKYNLEGQMDKVQKIKDARDLSALLQTDTKLYYSIARHIIKTTFEKEGYNAILNLLKLKTDNEVYELFVKFFN